MNKVMTNDTLCKAYTSVIQNWRAAAGKEVWYTSTVWLTDFHNMVGSLVDHEDDVENDLYEVLRHAYPNEGSLTIEIDRVGKWFDQRLKDLHERNAKYTRYEHLRVCTRAVNRALNDMSSDKRKQVLVVLISYELLEAERNGLD
tara:strand:+ start:2136 stop:2567 length:432 start_codon:yes stop_codon:yes gene_type:complete